MLVDNPVIDITTLCAVETLFRKERNDPYGLKLAGALADFIIYSEDAQLIHPISSATKTSALPDLAKVLMKKDRSVLRTVEYDPDTLSSDETRLLDNFSSFYQWAIKDLDSVHRWICAHREPWLYKLHITTIPTDFSYNVQCVRDSEEYQTLYRLLDCDDRDILYAFDVSMRYPLYGSMACDNYYLSHPIREGPDYRDKRTSQGAPPPIRFTFAKAFQSLLPYLSLVDYLELMLCSRYVLRDLGIAELPVTYSPRRKDVREICERIQMPPRLKARGRVFMDLLAAGLALGSIAPPISGYAVASSVGVVFLSQFYDRPLPRNASKLKWLRWAIDYDLERALFDDHQAGPLLIPTLTPCYHY